MDLIDLIKKQKSGVEGSFSKPLGMLHEFYINGVIKDSDEYVEVFDTIRHASENDVVKIYINSFGGDLFTAIQFMRVLSDTNATTIASVEGACMSAATMIFMGCDNFEVTPHSMFMFHNYSSMAAGKGHELYTQIVHERKWSSKLINDIYKDFLTDVEIEKVLDGVDIYMDGEEVVKRIGEKVEKLEAEYEAEAKAEAELIQEESKPKKKSAKTSVQ